MRNSLGGTAVVQLDGALLLLPLVALAVPSKVEGAVSEIWSARKRIHSDQEGEVD